MAPAASSLSLTPPPNLPPARYHLLGGADVWTDWRRTAALVKYLTQRHLAARYRGSALGFFWSFLNPVLMMLVYTFVFRFLFRAQIPGNIPYALFFLTGVLAWNCFSIGASNAASSVADQGYLFNKAWFPRIVLPLSAVASNTVNYLVTLPLILLFLACAGILPTWNFLLLPLGIAMLLAMTLGLGLILAAVAPFFRDLLQLLEVLMQVWFFATPILYPMSLPEDQLDHVANGIFWDIYRLNPMVGIIRLFQSIFLGLPVPWKEVGVAAFGTVVLLAVGIWLFRKQTPRFSESA